MNNFNVTDHNTLEAAKTKINELKARNKEIVEEIKTINTGKNSNIFASNLMTEYKRNVAMMSRLRNIETMYLECEITALTVTAMNSTKNKMNKTKKIIQDFDFKQYEIDCNKAQDNMERLAELNDLYECDDVLFDSDELKDELNNLINFEKL